MHISTAELRALRSRLNDAKKKVLKMARKGEQGWLDLPDDKDMVERVYEIASEKKKFKNCLVIGIGGSDLGARALNKAVRTKNGMKLFFAGGNTDPDELHATLSGLDLKKTLVNIISKSGNTIEPMAAFMIVREALKRKVGRKYGRNIVATTDIKGGSLRELAKKYCWATLPVPENVGGRFSVLSEVGLFPAACAGIDLDLLLRGAQKVRNAFVKELPLKNDACLFAALQYLSYKKHGKKMQVLMPYAEGLRDFGLWYRQLWAESLGKDGKGPTPIAAIGATDQHSQIQLYNDGPNDKTITFIEVKKFEHQTRVPSMANLPKLGYAEGKTLEQIIHAERRGTARALTENSRSNGTLFISRLNEENMGALIMFFEIATAISGELYGINTYDQPGVEAGKIAIENILK
ncbi:MAG: glucose-6-phosphate isomerase [Patescibacteria group bacterium]|nr:glucose-6-phosphate isomerase [Patescibacteria group bacterium]